VCMAMKEIGRIDEEYGFLYKSLILEEIQERFYENTNEGICFPIGENELAFFVTKVSDDELYMLIENMIDDTKINFSIGYDIIEGVKDLVDGYRHAFIACQRNFFHQNTNVFKYEDFQKKNLAP